VFFTKFKLAIPNNLISFIKILKIDADLVHDLRKSVDRYTKHHYNIFNLKIKPKKIKPKKLNQKIIKKESAAKKNLSTF